MAAQFDVGKNSNKIYFTKYQCSAYDRAYTGEKPYQCNICDVCITDRTNMGSHQILHTSENLFKCSYGDTYQTEKRYMNAISIKLELWRNLNVIYIKISNHVGCLKLRENFNSLV